MDNFTQDQDARFGGDAIERDPVPVYVPPGSMKLPPDLKQKFMDQGFATKWVRFFLNGGIDSANVRRKMSRSEGFTFVSPQDLSEEDLLLAGDVYESPYGEVIVSGDSVLMKTPLAFAEARREYMSSTTKSRSDAIKQRLRENQIHNDSRSITKTGKNANFSNLT